MFKAPAIYFPSTVVFFDDDHLYAKMLLSRLKIPYLKHFQSFDFLLKQKSEDLLFADVDVIKDTKMSELAYLKRYLPSLKKSGSLISTVISDLHMGEFSGADIFSQLTSPYLSRILVSNFLDYQNTSDISDLRNNGSIDMLLDKTKNFTEELPKVIMAAKNKFFTALSNVLFSAPPYDHALSDTEFAKFFLAKINELKPEEIRPNNTFTRFEFIFGKGMPNQVIHVTERREIQSNLGSSAAETAPHDLIPHLSSGRYMLCHEEEDDVLPDGRFWPLFIRPAKPLDGKNTRFFYSISEAQEQNRFTART